jgi:hypothetical protein
MDSDKQNVNMNNIIYGLLFILVSLNLNARDGYTYNKLPNGLPDGLPTKIKGNYRIIEHGINGAENNWAVYDTKSYTKDSDGLIMTSPIYYYDNGFGEKKWYKQTIHQRYHTQYMPELITIIDASVKLSFNNIPTIHKELTAQEAISKINMSLKNEIWTMKTTSYKGSNNKNGLLICGINTKVHTDNIRAIWYSSNGQVYNVNGIAKGNTPNFNFTFDVTIDNTLKICQSYK